MDLIEMIEEGNFGITLTCHKCENTDLTMELDGEANRIRISCDVCESYHDIDL